MKLAVLKIEGDFEEEDVVRFRGFIGRTFKSPDFHNHKGDLLLYRYPPVQYKYVRGNLHVVGKEEPVLKLLSLTEAKLNRIVPIHRKELTILDHNVSILPYMKRYQFITPWIALNQNNYRKFLQNKSKELLQSILVGNILSFGKGFGIWFDSRIKVRILSLDQVVVNFRTHLEQGLWEEDTKLIGFFGNFVANVDLPPLIGLGRKVAFGYGTISCV